MYSICKRDNEMWFIVTRVTTYNYTGIKKESEKDFPNKQNCCSIGFILHFYKNSASRKKMNNESMNHFTSIKNKIITLMLKQPEQWSLIEKENMKDNYLEHETGIRVYVFRGSISIDGKTFLPLKEEELNELSNMASLFTSTNRSFEKISRLVCCIDNKLTDYI